MPATWIDYAILLAGCVLLLPKLLAHVLNTSLIRWLPSLAERHGVNLTVSLGSLSLRRLCDLRVRAGRWRLPLPLPGDAAGGDGGLDLYASVDLSIESVGLQLFQRKPVTACVQGVRLVLILEEPTEEDRERERQQRVAARTAAPVAAPAAPAPHRDASSRRLADSVVEATRRGRPSVLHWPERSPDAVGRAEGRGVVRRVAAAR